MKTNNSLLSKKYEKSNKSAANEYEIVQEIITADVGFTLTRRMEWKLSDGKLIKYYAILAKDGDTWYDADISGLGGFSSGVTEISIGFSGFGITQLERAKHYIETLNIALAIATEENEKLQAGEFTPPEVKAKL